MLGSLGDLLATLITIFILVLIVRAIFSWFPGMLYSQAGQIIVMATEWYLAPIRRFIPPAAGLAHAFLPAIALRYRAPPCAACRAPQRGLASAVGRAGARAGRHARRA